MKQRTKRTLIRVLAAVLGFILLIAVISFIGKKTNGWQDDVTIDALAKRELNKDNLYKADNLVITKYNTGAGVVVNTTDDGVVVIDGKLGGETAVDVKIASVKLAAGTYTMTTGATVGTYTMYAYATADKGTTKLSFDFGGTDTDGVFTISADGTYDIYIHIEPDVEFKNVHLYPVIVEGDEAGRFYAKIGKK